MQLAPNHPLILYSDYHTITADKTRVSFSRPHLNHPAMSEVQPGARMSVCTDATAISIVCEHTAHVPLEDLYNGVGAITVDQVFLKTFSCGDTWDAAGVFMVNLANGSARMRRYDLIMPYGASVDVRGLALNDGAALQPVVQSARKRFIAYGDSTAQGFRASSVNKTWPFCLAAANQWSLVNLAYGGLRASAEHGIAVGQSNPDLVVMIVGYNDYFAQTPLDIFKAEIEGTLRNIRAHAPHCAIYVVTPLWAFRGEMKPFDLEHYRQAIREAALALGDAGTALIEGDDLAANDHDSFPDGTHPSDKGNEEIFNNLLEILRLKMRQCP